MLRSETAVVYLLAAGGAKDVADREKLEALYRAPMERLVDPETGVAFLPG